MGAAAYGKKISAPAFRPIAVVETRYPLGLPAGPELSGVRDLRVILFDAVVQVCGLLLADEFWVDLESQVMLAQELGNHACIWLFANNAVGIFTQLLTSRTHFLRAASK